MLFNNLAPNPSFEESIDAPDYIQKWGGAVRDNTEKFSGVYSLKIPAVATGRDGQLDMPKFVMPSNVELIYGGIIKTKVIIRSTETTFSGAGIFLYSYNEIGNRIGATGMTFIQGTNEWIPIVKTVKPPDGVAFMSLSPSVSHASSGTAWFDDIFCVRKGLLSEFNIGRLNSLLKRPYIVSQIKNLFSPVDG